MTSDLDIYRTASVLIREHGKDAALEAAQRADAMLEKGDMEGAAVWRRVSAQSDQGRALVGPGQDLLEGPRGLEHAAVLEAAADDLQAYRKAVGGEAAGAGGGRKPGQVERV